MRTDKRIEGLYPNIEQVWDKCPENGDKKAIAKAFLEVFCSDKGNTKSCVRESIWKLYHSLIPPKLRLNEAEKISKFLFPNHHRQSHILNQSLHINIP